MKNQILITLDSLRWDVFETAAAPYLKSLGFWRKAYTPGTYTLPAHISFFAGKLPQTPGGGNDYYDCAALHEAEAGAFVRGKSLWRLDNPETVWPAEYLVSGQNIVEGFRRKGLRTIGTGAVNWFNPETKAGKALVQGFQRFKFFDGPDFASHQSSEKQVTWVLKQLKRIQKPYFLFFNFGETHHPYTYTGCQWSGDKQNPYGDFKRCFERQKLCLEYLDGQIRGLLEFLKDFELVICSDHGEVMGEDGLWGHGFFHEKVMEVPLLIRRADAEK